MDFLKCILTAVGKAAAAAGDIPGCVPSSPHLPTLSGTPGPVRPVQHRGLMKHLMCITAGRGERAALSVPAQHFPSPAVHFPSNATPLSATKSKRSSESWGCCGRGEGGGGCEGDAPSS